MRLYYYGSFKLFFYEKISQASKGQKALKAVKAQKALEGTKALGQKHKNANKRISAYFPLRCFLRAFFIFLCLQAFCVCCGCEIFE